MFYEKLKRIGEGEFSLVWKAKDKRTGQIVALKESKSKRDIKSLKAEAEFLSQLSSPNIINLLSTFIHKKKFYLVLEFCDGNLLDIIDSLKNIKDILQISLQILTALAHIHSKGIIHTDLKPENIMFTKSPTGEISIKVADFGLAQLLEKTSRRPIQTRQYRAPEVIIYAPYDRSTDIWSFGCIFYELITRGDVLFDPFSAKFKGKIKNPRDYYHLLLFQKRLGPIPPSLLSRGYYSKEFFNSNCQPRLRGKYPRIRSLSTKLLHNCALPSTLQLEEIIRWSVDYLPEKRLSASQLIDIISPLLLDSQ